jgi:hypothetical protein
MEIKTFYQSKAVLMPFQRGSFVDEIIMHIYPMK